MECDVPKRDNAIVLGDCNARVACDDETWRGIIARHDLMKTTRMRAFVRLLCIWQPCEKPTLTLITDWWWQK